MTYLLPTTVESAVEALAAGQSTVVAGATDHYPAIAGGAAPTRHVVDITAVDELRGIGRDGDRWRIGALASWTDIARADLPAGFAGLQRAATQIGGVQIQNVASLAGNICNASPAADGIPPLLTLDASVELRSTRATRVLPLHAFVLGNRVTARQPDELLVSVLVPEPPAGAVGAFEKLGARAYQVISIVMVAALADIGLDGTIRSARLAVGACSPVAVRLTDLERDLAGVAIDHQLADRITPEHLEALSPIDDVRGTAEYRLNVTPRLIARALRSCQRPPP